MIKILAVILFFTTFTLPAKECVVISGAKKDYNNAMENAEIIKQDSQFNSWNCKVFDSWFLADDYLIKKNLKKGEQLLIISGAHGTPGGGAQNNSSEVDGEQIFNFLEKYSAKYKTAVMINSCYSGDLIRRKIKNDFIKDDQSNMANLCIVTSSYFNQYSYGVSEIIMLENLKKSSGQNILEYVSDKENFLISSSPWSTLGISQYLSLKDVNDAVNLLQELNNQLKQVDCGQGPASELVNLCRSSNLNAELLKDIVRYIEENEKIRQLFIDQNNDILDFLSKEEARDPNPPINSLDNYKRSCLLEIKSQLAFYTSPAYASSQDSVDYINFVTTSLKMSGRSCALYIEKKALITPQSDKTTTTSMGGVYGPNTTFNYNGIGGGMFGDPLIGFIDPEIDSIATNKFNFSFFKLKEYKKKLEDRVGKVGKNISPVSLVKALSGEQRECSSMPEAELKQFVDYIIGESNFNQNQAELANPIRSNNKFSPNLIMKALSNLIIQNKKEHPHDIVRRGACMNFKL